MVVWWAAVISTRNCVRRWIQKTIGSVASLCLDLLVTSGQQSYGQSSAAFVSQPSPSVTTVSERRLIYNPPILPSPVSLSRALVSPRRRRTLPTLPTSLSIDYRPRSLSVRDWAIQLPVLSQSGVPPRNDFLPARRTTRPCEREPGKGVQLVE